MSAHGTRSQYIDNKCRCDDCRAWNAEKSRNTRARYKTEDKDPADPRHGTHVFYATYGCRCKECSTAAAYQRRAILKQDIDPNDSRHGSPSFYVTHKCRCEECRYAMSDYRAARRNKKASS